MFFSVEDYRKIEKWLLANSKKDTQFPEADFPLSGDEIVAIVQDGVNRKIPVRTLLDQIELLEKWDFINVTEKFLHVPGTLEEAIASIPDNKKQLGLVISYLNNDGKWELFQYTGDNLTEWENIDLWNDLINKEDFKIPQQTLTLADEENLTTEKVSENEELVTYKIKLKNKAYDEEAYSGLGRVWLEKNIIQDPGDPEGEVANFLTQDMINEEDTVYYIQYEYLIPTGVDLMIPRGSILVFTEGAIDGPGTISFAGSVELIGSPIIGAHIGTNISNNGRTFGLYNTIIFSSWFYNMDAHDLEELTFEGYLTVLDSRVNLDKPVYLSGSVQTVLGGYLGVSTVFDWSAIEEDGAIITYVETSTTTDRLPIILKINSASIKANCALLHIQQKVLPRVPSKYKVNISTVTVYKGFNVDLIRIDNSSISNTGIVTIRDTNLELSGSIYNFRLQADTGLSNNGIHIVVPKGGNASATQNILIKDFTLEHIYNNNSGEEETTNGILVDGDSTTLNLTLDNVKFINAGGTGIYCKSGEGNINISNCSFYTEFEDTRNAITGIKVESDAQCSINGLHAKFSNNKTNLNQFLYINGTSGFHLRDAYIEDSGTKPFTGIDINNSQDFDIEATIKMTKVVDTGQSAVILDSRSAGKLVLNVDAPKSTGIQIPGIADTNLIIDTGSLDIKLFGNLSWAITKLGKNNIPFNIHDSIVKCTTFFVGTEDHNVIIRNNSIEGESLYSCMGSSFDSVISGNKIVTKDWVESDTSYNFFIPIVFTKGYNCEVSNNNIDVHGVFKSPVLRSNEGSRIHVINNIIHSNTEPVIHLGNTEQSLIIDNIINSDNYNGEYLVGFNAKAYGSLAQGNKVNEGTLPGVSNAPTIINDDGTQITKVTII